MRRSRSSRSNRRWRPAVVLRTKLAAPDAGSPLWGRRAGCPIDAGSVLEPNTETSMHSGKCSTSPNSASARSSYRNAPSARTAMCSAVALLARELRAVRAAKPVLDGPPPAASGADGISSAKIGRAPPRWEPTVRRAPRLIAATTGWCMGEATPASSLNAAMAQPRALTAPGPCRAVMNSANRMGSAGSQVWPRPVANEAHALSGPVYRFHVVGARPEVNASVTAGGRGTPFCCRRAAASVNRP